MARKPSGDDILVAAESFSGELADGTAFAARRDETRIRASHPAAARWPDYFRPINVHYDVEQATAAPAEKRGAPAKETPAAAKVQPSPAEVADKVEQATANPGEKRA